MSIKLLMRMKQDKKEERKRKWIKKGMIKVIEEAAVNRRDAESPGFSRWSTPTSSELHLRLSACGQGIRTRDRVQGPRRNPYAQSEVCCPICQWWGRPMRGGSVPVTREMAKWRGDGSLNHGGEYSARALWRETMRANNRREEFAWREPRRWWYSTSLRFTGSSLNILKRSLAIDYHR